MCAKVVALCACLFSSVAALGQNNVIDEVVWVVGDEAILKSDVESERLNAQYEGRKFDGDPYCIIPEQLAVQKLFLHQAELDSVEVTEQEVLTELEWRINYIIDQIGSKEKMEEYYNKTSTQIREMIRENIRNEKTVRKMQQEIIGDIKIADVRRYFKNLPQDSIPYVPTQVEVQIVTLEPKIPQEEIERVKKALRDYTEQITKGEIAFSTLARLYSEDEGTRRRGGELGFMGRGQLVPEYANVAFNLQDPDKISKIVESEFGFHIIELIEEPKNGMYRSRHILLKPSYTIEEQIEPTEYLDSLVAYIKNDSITFEVAAKEHSQDDLSKMNGGLVSNHDLLMNNPAFANVQYTQTKFRREDFGSGKNLNDYMALTKLKPGEVSTAFISEDVKGNPISKIVKLLEVIPTHAASLNEDYLTVEEMALEDKKYKHFEKWLRGKIDEIYVYVDPDFRDGEFMYKNWIK